MAPEAAGPTLGRRAFLTGVGAAAGLAAARGLGVGGLGAPDLAALDTPALLRGLVATLTPGQRERILLPADHPSRQITNTVAYLDRPHVGTLLGPDQLPFARELYRRMVSRRGERAFADTLAFEGRLEGDVLAIYGDPAREPACAVLTGGHLTLRAGATTGGNAAFGGPVAYGQQTGNGTYRVEGNGFAYHSDAANAFFAALSPAERRAAVLPAAPNELLVQLQGAGGRFPGVRAGGSGAARDAIEGLLEAVLSPFPEADQREARAAIDETGGPGALHVAVYADRGFYPDLAVYGELPAEERAARGDPYWQVWRIEGPGTVLFFKGAPHVHAYLQVARDPARSVGEVIARSDRMLAGDDLRTLLEAALRRATGEARAFCAVDWPGRLCPGEITTGLAWSVDPFGDKIAVAEIDEAAMGAALRARLTAAGNAPKAGERVRVATTRYGLSDGDAFGKPDRVEEAPLEMREALVAHLRAGGLAARAGRDQVARSITTESV